MTNIAEQHRLAHLHADVAITTPDAKRLANLRARCALQGVELLVSTDDRDRPLYVGTKWSLCRHMSTLDEVAEWVGRIDGQRE